MGTFRTGLAAGTLAALVACASATEPDTSVCHSPPGEFGASACALVRGRVVGDDGQALSGVSLTGAILPREGCSACNAPGLRIGADGRFSETVNWFAATPPAGDSAVAVVRVMEGAGLPAPRTDSARVVLRFGAPGAPVPVAEVEVRLRP